MTTTFLSMLNRPTIGSLSLELDALCRRTGIALKDSADEADNIRNSNDAAAKEIVILEREIDLIRGILQNKPKRMSVLSIPSFFAGKHSYETFPARSSSPNEEFKAPFKYRFDFPSRQQPYSFHDHLKTRISVIKAAQQFQEEQIRKEICQCNMAISSIQNIVLLQEGSIADLNFQLLQQRKLVKKYENTEHGVNMKNKLICSGVKTLRTTFTK
mmetsp:Transcript_11089/g.16205  ORF Transcript_11089/g.16205 Transcript_11089/m.16205 type:complete len:214 (-) Transcript_11089:105-746(-)